MTEILLKAADTVLTMDDAETELSGVDLRFRGGVITEVGTGLETAGEVIGLVWVHHDIRSSLSLSKRGAVG